MGTQMFILLLPVSLDSDNCFFIWKNVILKNGHKLLICLLYPLASGHAENWIGRHFPFAPGSSGKFQVETILFKWAVRQTSTLGPGNPCFWVKNPDLFSSDVRDRILTC